MSVQKLLYANIETVEDTDEFSGVPTTGTNIIDTVDLQIQPYEGNKIEKNVDRHLLGSNEQVNVSPQSIMSCGVYATGFGTAGTAALYDVLLRACGMARTDDATPGSEKNTYDIADSGHESLSAYVYMDDVDRYQLLTGARGSVAFSMSNGELPKFQFSNFIGSYNKPADGNRPVFAESSWAAWAARPALPMGKANTVTCALDGFAIIPSSINVDWGLQVNRLDLPNYKATNITDRAPTGSFTIKAPTMSEKDFFAKLESHNGVTKIPFSMIHGTSAGDIVELAASQFQIGSIADTEIEGEHGYTIEGRFIDNPQIIIR